MSLSVLTIPDGLQLAEVNGHGPVPSEVETVEGTVQLQLVNNSEDDVIIVTELICIKLGIEHPYSAFRGSRIETSSIVLSTPVLKVTCRKPRVPGYLGSIHLHLSWRSSARSYHFYRCSW